MHKPFVLMLLSVALQGSVSCQQKKKKNNNCAVNSIADSCRVRHDNQITRPHHAAVLVVASFGAVETAVLLTEVAQGGDSPLQEHIEKDIAQVFGHIRHVHVEGGKVHRGDRLCETVVPDA
eukprot:m.264692 g.264692  ORF g.264692 m.264692 type:complete len:121 (-) comp15620_c1_seq3:2781-3143(-)